MCTCLLSVLAGLGFYGAALADHRLATEYGAAPVCGLQVTDSCRALRPAVTVALRRRVHSRSPDDCLLTLHDEAIRTIDLVCTDRAWYALRAGESVDVERWHGDDTAVLTPSGAVRTQGNPEIAAVHMLLYGSLPLAFGISFFLYALFGKGAHARRRPRRRVASRTVVSVDSVDRR